ncbi:hypothetical protein [Pedobacter sp. SYSU D00535]|uniref:hypothetical protein n=1 Tax=Pedobacter sp. SYSU D00535 TaxID=2810308 RepID=UPI001A957093|nr:hypothetical protein [Pedobacter sp. SYSU D00535]
MKQILRAHPLLFINVFLFVLAILVLPNIFNAREERAFSDETRLQEAKEEARRRPGADSMDVIPGSFYKRNALVQAILGSAYRNVWQQPVRLPVLRLNSAQGGLTPIEFSGGMQTIGVRARDTLGRIWAIRSINKDQSAALPEFLRFTILRPMFRDQAASLNPYGVLVAMNLSQKLGVSDSEARLYYFPYDTSSGKYNDRMAGRAVMLTRYQNSRRALADADTIKMLDTEEMLKLAKTRWVPLDTQLYLRWRLFDILISDWDRHEGNWKWALLKRAGKEFIIPLPVDRDMAFYKFGDGLLNWVSSAFVKKLQSFTPNYESIEGLVAQSKTLDLAILRKQKKERFLREAKFIQQTLDKAAISSAFRQYPPNVYKLIGAEHEEIFEVRLKNLDEAASEFFSLLQKEAE